jgi:outer membrane protein assembly factor BamB
MLAPALLAIFLSGSIQAADAQDLAFPGGVIWQIKLDPPPAQLPAFDAHSVYLVLRDGHVRAIDSATGDERWLSPASSTVRPASSGRHLVGADSSTAWCLDAA